MQILITLNNYFHDLASAVVLVSGLAYYYGQKSLPLGHQLLHKLKSVNKLALVWIIIGGIIRTLAFERYELVVALDRQLIVALVVKHILLLGALTVGLWLTYGGAIKKQ